MGGKRGRVKDGKKGTGYGRVKGEKMGRDKDGKKG